MLEIALLIKHTPILKIAQKGRETPPDVGVLGYREKMM